MNGRGGRSLFRPENTKNSNSVASDIDNTDGPITVSIVRRIFYKRLELCSGNVRRGHRRLCLRRRDDEQHEDPHDYFAHEMTPLFYRSREQNICRLPEDSTFQGVTARVAFCKKRTQPDRTAGGLRPIR